VKSATTRAVRLLLWPLALLAALPTVFARSYYTGISPLNRVVELLSKMFTIPALSNSWVQLGFIRFCLFVLFLAVAHWVFKKLFDNKTAGVIATVFALISAFLMPENWVTANGGVITAVFTGLIPLGIVILTVWFCVKKLDSSFISRLIAIVLLLVLLAILDVYKTAVGLPIIFLLPRSFFTVRTNRKRGGR